jgi:hypothetical protein
MLKKCFDRLPDQPAYDQQTYRTVPKVVWVAFESSWKLQISGALKQYLPRW